MFLIIWSILYSYDIIDSQSQIISYCRKVEMNLQFIKFYQVYYILFIELYITDWDMPKSQVSPSIHQIVLDQRKSNAKKSIHLLFHKVVYPNFPIHEFQFTGQLAKDHRYYQLASQLRSWNKNNCQTGSSNQNLRAQFTRNQFIYTSLKNIIAHGSKGNQNFQKNLSKLHEWYKNNCKQHNQVKYTSRKKKTWVEDDWKVRKTYKSNMPLEINTYQRRVICMEPPVDEQAKVSEQISFFQLQQFKIKQNKIRQQRQKQEIKIIANRFTQNKRKSVQKLQKNYFIGKFQGKQRFLSKHAKNNQTQKMLKIAQQSMDSEMLPKFQEAQPIMNDIKKYRLNTSLGFRCTQRRSHDPFTRKNQKADTTISTNIHNSTFQGTLKNDDYSQFYPRRQKISTFLLNIEGGGLMKNPFESKKLKKVFNKRK